jgi:hypothetical protein
MLRRNFVGAVCCAVHALADDRTDALDAVAPIAAALSNGDTAAALAAIPRELGNYAELRENLTGLIAQAEVTSSVDVVSAEPGAAELDWYMQIRNRSTGMVVARRRGTVRVRFRKRKLLALEPASFFAPPNV